MKLLIQYLKRYKGLIALALALASINQIFSLLDPLVFKHIVDNYATNPHDYSKSDYVKGI